MGNKSSKATAAAIECSPRGEVGTKKLRKGSLVFNSEDVGHCKTSAKSCPLDNTSEEWKGGGSIFSSFSSFSRRHSHKSESSRRRSSARSSSSTPSFHEIRNKNLELHRPPPIEPVVPRKIHATPTKATNL